MDIAVVNERLREILYQERPSVTGSTIISDSNAPITKQKILIELNQPGTERIFSVASERTNGPIAMNVKDGVVTEEKIDVVDNKAHQVYF